MRFVIFRHPKDKPNENATKSFCCGTCPDDILLFPSVFFFCVLWECFLFLIACSMFNRMKLYAKRINAFVGLKWCVHHCLWMRILAMQPTGWTKKNARVVWTEYIIPVEILQRKYFKWLNSIFCASRIDSCLRPLFVIYLRLAWLYHVSVFFFSSFYLSSLRIVNKFRNAKWLLLGTFWTCDPFLCAFPSKDSCKCNIAIEIA